jgi:ABC-type multidrug transport system fused ATPase/permease subunit
MRTRIATFLLIAAVAIGAAAQVNTPAKPALTVTTTSAAVTTEADSREMREVFQAVLNRYPPEVAKVLKLDPALLSNQAYLASYPALATFLSEHPEVAHSPSYYLERVWVPGDAPLESASARVWRSLMEGISIFLVILIFAGVFMWVIRTVIEHQRWNRASKTQAEVHNRLMDRLTSNEELLAYIQTPAGRRFLESAPIPVEAAPRGVSAPVGRILWSVQVGLVLASGGIGMEIVSRFIEPTVAQPLFAIGVLGIALGAGFVLSAIVSFALSRKLGLWEPAPLPGDTPPPNG